MNARKVVPAIAVGVYGACWIALHSTGGRGATHTVFQIFALGESVLAVYLRDRKPVGAVVSIAIVYLLVDLEPILLPPLLIVLFTLARLGTGRMAALAASLAAAGLPYLHGDAVPFPWYAGFHVAAIGCAITLGRYLRARQEIAQLREGPLNASPAVPAD